MKAVKERVPVDVWRQLEAARSDAARAASLVRGGEGAALDSALARKLLEAAGDGMAEAASHPDVPAVTARLLLRARDSVDAHLLAAESLYDLDIVDDAERLLVRAAGVILASFTSDQDSVTG